MDPRRTQPHPRLTRRAAVQAGAIGLLGLGTNHLSALSAMSPSATPWLLRTFGVSAFYRRQADENEEKLSSDQN